MSDASKARTRRKIARRKKRYAEEPEFREKVKTESRAYRITNADAVNLKVSPRRGPRRLQIGPIRRPLADSVASNSTAIIRQAGPAGCQRFGRAHRPAMPADRRR
jgi:hypothetical protein